MAWAVLSKNETYRIFPVSKALIRPAPWQDWCCTCMGESTVKATVGNNEPSPESEYENDHAESPDPNDSDLLRDQLKGETVEHAKPPRLEDEGQSGGGGFGIMKVPREGGRRRHSWGGLVIDMWL